MMERMNMTADATNTPDAFEIDHNLGDAEVQAARAAAAQRATAAAAREEAAAADAARLAALRSDVPAEFEITHATEEAAPAPAVETTTEPANPLGIAVDQIPTTGRARGEGRDGGRLAADVPAPLRAGIEAARARRANQPAAPAQRTETDAQRAAREAREARAAAQAALDSAIRIGLSSQDGTYPHGCLVAWHPAGVRTWSSIAAVAEDAGVPAPAQRSLRAIAADAVRSIEGNGLRVEVVKRGKEWVVYRPAGTSEIGASIGDARVVAALEGDTLTVVGPDDLCATVTRAFADARAEATIGSTEVTQWLGAILASWRAVPMAYGRWVPPGEMTERWVRLAGALAAATGRWMPARPAGIMSREDIRGELHTGLTSEVDSLIGEIANDRDRAHKAAKELGAAAAANALAKVADLRIKLGMYETLTGPMPEEHTRLDALAADLATLTDDTAQRGAMLELE
jgi:hypothetical protein